jgi:hypothetical protein
MEKREYFSHLIQFKLQGHVLAAFGAVVIREAATFDRHVFAHVDAPCVVRVAREEAVWTDFYAIGPYVVIVITIVPGIRVTTHCFVGLEGFWRCEVIFWDSDFAEDFSEGGMD